MSVKVSVVVPVYNAVASLSQCLASLRTQTLGDIEIILVDDGSSDGSGEACDLAARADGRIRVLHIENGGPANARNRGMETAAGEYIGFADADDRVEPEMYAQLYAHAADSDADMAVCNYLTGREGDLSAAPVLPGGKAVWERQAVRERILPYFFGYEDGELGDYKRHCPFADTASYVWLALYRTRMIRENGLFFPSEKLYYTEDNLFNLPAVNCCTRLCYLPLPLYHHLETGNSFTGRYNPHYFSMRLHKYAYLRDFIGHNGLSESFYHRLQNKICAESISLIDYYVAAKGLNFSQKLEKVRAIAENGLVAGALAEANLAALPLSAQKVFLQYLKKKRAGTLLLLSEGYVRMVKLKSVLK